MFLHVPDVAAARAFYTQKLGFAVEAEAPSFVQFAQSNGQGAYLALGQETATTAKEPELWWYVDDADATFAALVAQLVEVVTPPTDMPFGRTFAIKDPDGQILNFLQLA
ncbi:MAG: hypothetical protein OJF49_004612 [Ktedonobacterales bacterium]|nr:MAG: hypothetical protein OJF49_004612 [Ktedonobacterales bacterium]